MIRGGSSLWTGPGTDEKREYFAGLDLGQRQDFTTIAVVERREARSTEFDWAAYARREVRMERRFAVRYLERVNLGTPYPGVVERVRAVTCLPELRGRCTLAADATGVGAPVVELLRAAGLGCEVIGVTITGGAHAARTSAGWHVPKRDLLHGLRVMLERGELRIAKGLKLAGTLVEELVNIRTRVGASGSETFGASRQSVHDDLALAVALACWRARMGQVGEMGKRLCY